MANRCKICFGCRIDFVVWMCQIQFCVSLCISVYLDAIAKIYNVCTTGFVYIESMLGPLIP